jgi:hypothetical protein
MGEKTMAAASYHIIVDQYADYRRSFQITSDGSAVDLSGYTCCGGYKIMAYSILGKDDENLRVTATDGDIVTIDVNPATLLLEGGLVSSVNGLIGDVVLTTNEITENNNLYYTDARVDDYLQSGGITSINFANNSAYLSYNANDATLDLTYDGTGVVLQIGQEEHMYAKTTEAIENGDIMMFAGAQGNHLLVSKADPTSPGFKPEYIVGIATATASANQYVYITTFGKVRDLDTKMYNEGDIIWMGADGSWTTVEPTPPQHIIQLAAVVRSHRTHGTIFVRPSHKPDTDETPEGSTNLYYTDDRVNAVIDSRDFATTGYVDGAVDNLSAEIYSLPSAEITPVQIDSWTTAYGWGDHTEAGYLTSYTETDPVFGASPAGTITAANIVSWNTAWGWGDHTEAGYLTQLGSIDGHTDVTTEGATTGQVLVYNAITSTWEPGDVAGGEVTIEDVTGLQDALDGKEDVGAALAFAVALA